MVFRAESFGPQGLKPAFLAALNGTAYAVPYPKPLTNNETGSQGAGLSRFAWLRVVCALFALAGLARAQQVNIAAGGSTLFSTKPISASEAYIPPPENGGTYPNLSAEVIQDRFGLSAEVAFRYHKGLYDGYQRFRPVVYDVNAVFAPQFTKRTVGDFMAGAGAQTTIFYDQFATCQPAVCANKVNSTHLLLHAEGGVRYYFFRKFFARPEANYYRVIHSDFHSGNVLRLGASIGYTFGSK